MVVGTVCPAINGLTFIKGGPVAIGEPSTGAKRVLVLEFWATWCPPCRDNIPHLTEIQHKYADKDVKVVGITQEPDVKKVEAFVRDQGNKMDYCVAIDTAGEAEELMAKAGARGIPHAFVIDVDNKIVFSGHPMDPGFATALDRAAASASSSKPPPTALPLIKESYEELLQKSAKELKQILVERGISTAGCLEKSDLAKKIVEFCSTVTYYK